jgi:cyclomaltodextrinase
MRPSGWKAPYYDWYEFTGASEPDQAYRQWANPTLANLQESDSWKDFAFRNADSVTKFWLDQGASRLEDGRGALG